MYTDIRWGLQTIPGLIVLKDARTTKQVEIVNALFGWRSHIEIVISLSYSLQDTFGARDAVLVGEARLGPSALQCPSNSIRINKNRLHEMLTKSTGLQSENELVLHKLTRLQSNYHETQVVLVPSTIAEARAAWTIVFLLWCAFTWDENLPWPNCHKIANGRI